MLGQPFKDRINLLVFTKKMDCLWIPEDYRPWIGKAVFAIDGFNDNFKELYEIPEARKIVSDYLQLHPAFPCMLNFKDKNLSEMSGLLAWVLIACSDPPQEIVERVLEDGVMKHHITVSHEKVGDLVVNATDALIEATDERTGVEWGVEAFRYIKSALSKGNIGD